MKRFSKLFIILFIICCTAQSSWAQSLNTIPSPDGNYKVLVLPDNIEFARTNYLIYPDSSIIFASDIINELKKDGVVQTVSMTKIRDTFRKNPLLSHLTKRALKEFKYNYNIPFVDFKSIAHRFSTNKVLVITSQTDVQNYLLRRTLWDFLNIPGATVINPAYKLSTYIALIDVDSEKVLWQHMYEKMISSRENRMVASTFAPATEQLEKIKNYSTSWLSIQVALKIQSNMLPPPILNPKMNVYNKQKNETAVASMLPTLNETEPKPRTFIPTRSTQNDNGVIINDL